MSYQVLARKYRPQNFGDVLGQQHVTRTLQNALTSDRLHHAYLFCGARGVGKTTIARILAKTLNCEKGIGNEPCNACENCEDVTAGRSLDVQEIDGASSTGVDDVRQVREQTKFLPAKGRYKVYIIDEVHMLSTSAFNALLKTLEEPPAHVIFIFATTEPHKIPTTILSRCQRYDFKRIPVKQLESSLGEIAKNECVTVSPEALSLIAYEAQGSLRDGQSLLDQAIAFSGSEISYEKLQEMLGFLDRKLLWRLLESLLQKDRKTALNLLNQFYETGSDLNRLAQDLTTHFRHLILLKALPEKPDWFDLPAEEIQKMTELAATTTLEEIDQLFHLAYRGFEAVARSQQPKMLFEVLLIRMTQVGKIIPSEDLLQNLEGITLSASASALVDAPSPSPDRSGESPKTSQEAAKNWPQFLLFLHQKKPQLASIIDHGKLVDFNENRVALKFEVGSLYGEMLKEEDRQTELRKWLSEFFGKPVGVEVLSAEASASAPSASTQKNHTEKIRNEALQSRSVQDAANILGATVEEVHVK